MVIQIMLMVWCGTNNPTIAMVKQRVYDPVPENAGYYLTGIASADLDDSGRLYLLDANAKVIFRWASDGSFKDVIGRPGQGPGEFAFVSRFGSQAYLGVVGDVLYVFDGGQQKIQRFNMEGKYLDGQHIKMANGRTEGFFVSADHQFYLQNYNFMSQPGSFNLTKLNLAEKTSEVVFSMTEKEMGKPNLNPPGDGSYYIEAYYPAMVSAFCRAKSRMVVGIGNKPSFQVIDTRTGTRKAIDFAYPRLEVSKADREEYEGQNWLKRSPGAKLVYPEKHSYFDQIYPLVDGGYLVFHISPVESRIRGILLDEKGVVLGRFNDHCGQNGNLLSANGRVIRVKVLEDGAFEIAVLGAS